MKGKSTNITYEKLVYRVTIKKSQLCKQYHATLKQITMIHPELIYELYHF